MRLALIILATVTLVGCSDGTAPPAAPTMPVAPTPSAWIVAMVAEDGGLCIQGATVEVVAGQAPGRSETQTEPCDVWDAGGVTFQELVPGVELTLRASAPGYVAQEKVVVPRSGPQTAVIFTLTPSR